MKQSKGQQQGQILQVSLPQNTPRGHEQVGMRPCILIADPSTIHSVRYPVIIVAPLTTRSLPNRILYPRLKKGVGGIPAASTVLLDQLTAIDTNRVKGYIGTLTKKEFDPIRKALQLMFR